MKLVLKPYKFLSAGNLNGSFNSSCPSTLQADLAQVQANYSGANPAGTLKMQGSIDNGTNWVDLPFLVNGSIVYSFNLASVSSPILMEVQNPMPNLRLNFTTTGGAVGTIDAYISYKRLSA